MIVRLCLSQLQRLGSTGSGLVSTLRDRGHIPAPQGCLDRCQACEKQLIAVADGAPIAAPSVEALLEQVEAIAAED